MYDPVKDDDRLELLGMCLYGDERMRIGKGTKVWDEKGLWGDHVIGEGCVIGEGVMTLTITRKGE